jgi:hypothetical protein
MLNWLLKNVMNYIVGKDIFGKVQKLVTEVALDEKLTGAEKKEKVIASAKTLGADITTSALNLAVEAAVKLIKDKQTK